MKTTQITPMAAFARYYAQNSAEMFPSFDPDVQAKRTGTTFYGDFKVAEAYSGVEPSALADTWRRAWAARKNSAEYMVELCLVMNHLCWEHQSDEKLCRWYADKYHYCYNRIFASGGKDEPLPEGCRPFTREEHSFAFDVLD